MLKQTMETWVHSGFSPNKTTIAKDLERFKDSSFTDLKSQVLSSINKTNKNKKDENGMLK